VHFYSAFYITACFNLPVCQGCVFLLHQTTSHHIKLHQNNIGTASDCNRIGGAPDLDPDLAGYPVEFMDPIQIQIQLNPMFMDLVWIWIRPDPVSRSGWCTDPICNTVSQHPTRTPDCLYLTVDSQGFS
jgi:hypothetical protein